MDKTEVALVKMLGLSGGKDKAEAFGKSLAERCGIEPVFKDERYTTVLASRYLHESNIKAKKQKKVIDQVAAEIILQDYLNTL